MTHARTISAQVGCAERACSHPNAAILCGIVAFAGMLLTPAFAQPVGEWRPATASRAAPATYAAPNGEVAVTIRCGPSRGYVEQVFVIPGALDLSPSPHGDGRMVDLTISYRSVGGPGGLTSGELATVAPREGGHELVAATTANSMPNLAAGESRTAAFDVAVGGRAFKVPFLPPDLAGRLERECDFRWYDRALGGIGFLFSNGR